MRYLLVRILAPALLVLAGWQSAAVGQAPPSPAANPEAEKVERGPPALQWVVAIGFTMIILLIVCMPSRKA